MQNASLKTAGQVTMLAGIAHLLGVVISGFSYGLMGLLPFGVICILLGAGLTREMRGLGYVTYLAIGIGLAFIIAALFSVIAVPAWSLWLILALDALALLLLFLTLWKPKPVPTDG